MTTFDSIRISEESWHKAANANGKNKVGERWSTARCSPARVIGVVLLAGSAAIAWAQAAPPTTVTLPASSVAGPNDSGVLAHTYLQVLTSSQNFTAAPQVTGPPFSGYLYQTPASIACIYNLQSGVSGCNPNTASQNPTGGGGAIGIVDAFDDPKAFADLQFFSNQFGLTAITSSSFQVVYAPTGAFPPGACTAGPATRPPSALGTGWDVEESLDIEWSHAMAPQAKVYLVEAQSNSDLNLYCAVSVASSLVKAAGGGEVSMSWGGSEFAAETLADPVFTTPGVVYFASAGDSPGVSYPAASPNVISAGGTSLSFDPVTGDFIGENTWQDTGGGASLVEPRPSYQNGNVAHIVGSQRGTPDVASDANPDTGVWVWDSLGAPPGGYWYIVGGTSVSSPTWAGIVNAAGGLAASSQAELTQLYSDPAADFTGIKVGNCGPYMSIFASGNWDFCSGRGSPKGYKGK